MFKRVIDIPYQNPNYSIQEVKEWPGDKGSSYSTTKFSVHWWIIDQSNTTLEPILWFVHSVEEFPVLKSRVVGLSQRQAPGAQDKAGAARTLPTLQPLIMAAQISQSKSLGFRCGLDSFPLKTRSIASSRTTVFPREIGQNTLCL